MQLNIPSEPLPITANHLGYIFEMPITSTMMMGFINIIIFIILFIAVSRFSVKNPSKFQILIEYIFNTVKGLINQIAGEENISKKIMPFVFSLIILILVSDIILTFLPILTGFTYLEIPIFRSQTNDINTTMALAVISVVAAQLFSIYKLTPFNYLFKYIKIKQIIIGFSKGIGSGLMSLIDAFIGILDIISEIAKIISLSLRLFGNMFAGELLQGVLMSLFALFLPLPMMGLSLLSGVIQAIVFGALVSSYLSSALKEEI